MMNTICSYFLGSVLPLLYVPALCEHGSSLRGAEILLRYRLRVLPNTIQTPHLKTVNTFATLEDKLIDCIFMYFAIAILPLLRQRGGHCVILFA